MSVRPEPTIVGIVVFLLPACGPEPLDLADLERVDLWTEVLSEETPDALSVVDHHGLVGMWESDLRHLDVRNAASTLDRSGLTLRAAAHLPSGELVVATEEDLRVWVDGLLVPSALTEAVGAPVDRMVAANGQLWLSAGGRLMRFDGHGLSDVEISGARPTGPFALGSKSSGQVWMATTGGLVALDTDTVRPVETAPDIRASSVAADCSGQVWAVDGDILWERRGRGDWIPHETTLAVHAVSAHPGGEGVWIHTEGPVVHATSEELRSGSRSAPDGLAVDALGRLLVADGGGLFRYATGPTVAVVGLQDEATIAAPRSIVLAPSMGSELAELAAYVNGEAVFADLATGEVVVDPSTLPTTDAHRFEAVAVWENGARAEVEPLSFRVDRAGNVTWETDIEPLYGEHCAICHGGSSETVLDTPEAWSSRIDTILELVSTGAMPIGGSPLTDGEIAIIEAWQEANFP